MSRKDNTIILGIESSCDETAAAVLRIRGGSFDILSNVVYSQIPIHQQYGGVVPEIAARNHVKQIIPTISKALAKAKVGWPKINRIAVTAGPGLITSLLVGVETAKTIAYVKNIPLHPVNHLKGHLFANWLNNQPISLPALCLIVSGGHTELVLIKSPTNLKKISATVDDAAGEAFDKVAQLLHLGYPGGPAIAKLAVSGNPTAFKFPRPMMNSNNFTFSFSGLKTAVLYAVKKLPAINYKLKADLCASFQQTVVDVLVAKTIAAARQYRVKTVLLAGGVAANTLLRKTLKQHAADNQLNFQMPAVKFCTDNAAMIAAAGYFAKPLDWQKVKVDPNLEI